MGNEGKGTRGKIKDEERVSEMKIGEYDDEEKVIDEDDENDAG